MKLFIYLAQPFIELVLVAKVSCPRESL